MFEYMQTNPFLSGIIWGALLWGTLYTILGFVYKDDDAKKIGLVVFIIGLIALVIA